MVFLVLPFLGNFISPKSMRVSRRAHSMCSGTIPVLIPRESSQDQGHGMSQKPIAPPCRHSFLLPSARSLHRAGPPFSLNLSLFPATFPTTLGTLVSPWGAVGQKPKFLNGVYFSKNCNTQNKNKEGRQATSITANTRKSHAGAVGSTH